MSIEHMRSRNTLSRNMELLVASEAGDSFASLAREHGLTPSSVRSSVVRMHKHLRRFLERNPDVIMAAGHTWKGRFAMIKAFGDHVGVQVKIRGIKRRAGPQADLF